MWQVTLQLAQRPRVSEVTALLVGDSAQVHGEGRLEGLEEQGLGQGPAQGSGRDWPWWRELWWKQVAPPDPHSAGEWVGESGGSERASWSPAGGRSREGPAAHLRAEL